MYILDTCAIRGISRKKLESAIQNGIDIAICPITGFELASHLIKATKDGYSRALSNFLKCRVHRLLDDSAVLWADRAGVPQSVNQSRREDRDLLAQMIEIVSETESLDDLHAKHPRYPDGVLCSLVNCGEMFGEILQGEERQHVDRMTSLLGTATFFRSLNGSYAITRRVLMENLEGAGRGVPANMSTSRHKAISNASVQAPYVGYMLYRLYEAKNKGRMIDGNDYEDALICLAIDWAARDILVTGDKGTIEALRHTAALLEREDCVISTDEFIRRECL